MLYIPGMTSNLLIICQLIEKNYKVVIKDKMIGLLDSSEKLMLKASTSQNTTFEIELDVLEHRCLETATRRDE